MKKYLLLLFALLLSVSAAARDKSGVEFFVRVVPNADEVIKGDSTLVSFVFYSTAPVSSATMKPEVLKVKNARVRRLHTGRGYGSSRARENGKIYYTQVGAQFVVATEQLGTLTVPECEFEATFRFRKSSGDPFEEFFGFGGQTVEIKEKAKSEQLKIEVVRRPQRTMREMMREGVM